MKNNILKIFTILSFLMITPNISEASLGGSIPIEKATEAVSSTINEMGGTLAGGVMVTPFWNVVSTTQWNLFFSEFEISLDIGWCSRGFFSVPGFKARMIEPIGYFESSKTRFDFVFIGMDFSTPVDFFQTGGPRNVHNEDTNDGGRDDVVWSHFINFPIFGLLFGTNLQFVCFTGGEMEFGIMSEFLPGYTVDVVYANLAPHHIIMYTPLGLITSIADCVSTISVNTMHGFTTSGITEFDNSSLGGGVTEASSAEGSLGAVEYFLNSIRNTFFWDVGCLSFSPVGGYVAAEDPGADHELLAYGMMNLMHGAIGMIPSIKSLHKQTEFAFGGIPVLTSMCQPLPTLMYPTMIESQYLVQRAGIPTIGSAHAFGTTPALTTTLANLPGSGDRWVSLIWQYRDYYAFAYRCPQF